MESFPGLGPTSLNPPYAAERVRETLTRTNVRLESLNFTPATGLEAPSDDLVKTEYENLTRKLSLYGLQERKTKGDGNCQFRALSDQIYGTEEFHEDVRRAVVMHLQAHEAAYRDYVPKIYAVYLAEMIEDGTWGDHLTLKACADAIGAQINLITSYEENGVVQVMPEVRRSEKELWLSFWAEVHYNSLEAQAEFRNINSHVSEQSVQEQEAMADDLELINLMA